MSVASSVPVDMDDTEPRIDPRETVTGAIPLGASVSGDNVDSNGSGAQPFAGVVPPVATFAGPSAEQFNAPAASPGAARGRVSAARSDRASDDLVLQRSSPSLVILRFLSRVRPLRVYLVELPAASGFRLQLQLLKFRQCPPHLDVSRYRA